MCVARAGLVAKFFACCPLSSRNEAQASNNDSGPGTCIGSDIVRRRLTRSYPERERETNGSKKPSHLFVVDVVGGSFDLNLRLAAVAVGHYDQRLLRCCDAQVLLIQCIHPHKINDATLLRCSSDVISFSSDFDYVGGSRDGRHRISGTC